MPKPGAPSASPPSGGQAKSDQSRSPRHAIRDSPSRTKPEPSRASTPFESGPAVDTARSGGAAKRAQPPHQDMQAAESAAPPGPFVQTPSALRSAAAAAAAAAASFQSAPARPGGRRGSRKRAAAQAQLHTLGPAAAVAEDAQKLPRVVLGKDEQQPAIPRPARTLTFEASAMQDYDASGPPQRRQRAQVMGQRSVVLDLTEDAAILGPKSRARIEPIPKHAEPAVPDMTLADSSSTDTAFTERGTTPDLVRGGEEEKDETSSRRARGAKPNAAARAARAETKGPAKPPKRGPGSVTSLLNVMGESAPPGPCQHHSQRHSQRHSQHHCQHHDLTADTSGDDAAADRPQDLTGEDAEDGVAAAPASRKPRAKLRSKTGTRKRGRPAAAHVIDDDHEQGEDEDGDEDYSSKRAASAKLAKWAKKAGKSRRRSNSAKAGASSPVKVIHMLDDAYTPPRATRAMLRAMSEFGPLVELSVVLEEQEDKLGARVVPEPGHGGGFLVKTVATAGLAERAGVQPGDRLKTLGDIPAQGISGGAQEFETLLATMPRPVAVEFARGGIRRASAGSDEVREVGGSGKTRRASPVMPQGLSQPPVPRWERKSAGHEAHGGQEVDLTMSGDEEGAAAGTAAAAATQAGGGEGQVAEQGAVWHAGQIVVTEFGVGSVHRQAPRAGPVTVVLHWDAEAASRRAGARYLPSVYLGAGARVQDASLQRHVSYTAPAAAAGGGGGSQQQQQQQQQRATTLVLNRADTARLWPGLHLNDTVIDLFMARLFHEQLKRERTHVFSSFFFSALAAPGKLQPGRFQHWTKNLDLFSMDYVVLPVNEVTHWSLAIVCNVSSLPAVLRGDELGAKLPVILKMDSTKGHPTQKVSGVLRAWLGAEWNLRHPRAGAAADDDNDDAGARPTPTINAKILPVVAPVLPLQDNDCDCGVFLIEFAERFFRDVEARFVSTPDAIRREFKDLFVTEDEHGVKHLLTTADKVARKRREFIQVVKEMSLKERGMQLA